MAGDIKISQEIIDKLNMVQEFIDELYYGKQHHKPRIAFMASTLNDTIKALAVGGALWEKRGNNSIKRGNKRGNNS